MRAKVRTLVEGIGPVDQLEAENRDEVLAWIDSGEPIWRIEKPANPPMHLVSYSVLVDLETRRILLVDHRDAGLWLPAGGHIEPGEDPARAAARELNEELGIEPKFLPLLGQVPLMVTVCKTGGISAGLVTSGATR